MSLDKRKSFQLHYNFFDQFSLLSMEDRGELITAIFEYSIGGEISHELSPVVNMAFSCIKFVLDLEKAAYAQRCAKNSANGKKGGRPSETEAYAELVAEKPLASAPSVIYEPRVANERSECSVCGGVSEAVPTAVQEAVSTAVSTAVCAEAVSEKLSVILPTEVSESDREKLISVGVPADYIDERAARAVESVRASASPYRTIFSVILGWWEQDKEQYKRKQSYSKSSRASPSPFDQLPKSYDLDDFFNASVNRSMKDFEAKYGPISD